MNSPILGVAPSHSLPPEAVDELLAALALSPDLAADHLPETPEEPETEQ